MQLKKIYGTFTAILIATSALTSPSSAEGPYMSAFGGFGWTQDQDFEAVGLPETLFSGQVIPPEPSELKFDGGSVFGGALGYELDFLQNAGLRLEAEVSRRSNELDPSPVNGTDQRFEGKTKATAFMANVYVTAPSSWGIQPYIGGGVGAASIKTNAQNQVELVDFAPNCALPDSTLPANTRSFSSKKTKFAYQIIGGASAPITDKLSFFAEGRYFRGKGARHNASYQIIDDCGVDFAEQAMADTGRYKNISALAGIRVHF